MCMSFHPSTTADEREKTSFDHTRPLPGFAPRTRRRESAGNALDGPVRFERIAGPVLFLTQAHGPHPVPAYAEQPEAGVRRSAASRPLAESNRPGSAATGLGATPGSGPSYRYYTARPARVVGVPPGSISVRPNADRWQNSGRSLLQSGPTIRAPVLSDW